MSAPAAVAHMPVLHVTGSLSDATADVAKILHGMPLEYQRNNSLALFTFLTDTTPSFLRLNKGVQLQVVLVSVPKTKFVEVVYCVGVGSSLTGVTPAPVGGKILLLQGEGNAEFGPLKPLCLRDGGAYKRTECSHDCGIVFNRRDDERSYVHVPSCYTERGDRHRGIDATGTNFSIPGVRQIRSGLGRGAHSQTRDGCEQHRHSGVHAFETFSSGLSFDTQLHRK